jgi:hypothetical protein
MPRPFQLRTRAAASLALLACLLLPVALGRIDTPALPGTPADSAKAAAVEGFLQALQAGDSQQASAYLSTDARAVLVMDDVNTMWRELKVRHGALRRCAPAHAMVREGRRLWVSELEYDRETLRALFRVNSQGLVTGFNVEVATADGVSMPVDARGVVEQPFAVADLPGTLVLPEDGVRLPAIVLVHGSGRQDRDGTIGPNKPLRDIAYGLAQSGIATLRYDKRSRARPQTLGPGSTANETTVDDAVRAIALLRRHPRVDPDRVFVLGHSLGGYLLPRIGARDRQLAGLVVVSGLAQPLYQSIPRQVRYLSELDGQVSELERVSVDHAEYQLSQILAMLAGGPEPSDPMLNIPAAYWRDLASYDPMQVARSLPQPMLLIQGGRDYQVTLDDDFARWRSGLAGREDTELLTYPALNHLLMAGKGPANSAEYSHPRHVDRQLIGDLQRWINAH